MQTNTSQKLRKVIKKVCPESLVEILYIIAHKLDNVLPDKNTMIVTIQHEQTQNNFY